MGGRWSRQVDSSSRTEDEAVLQPDAKVEGPSGSQPSASGEVLRTDLQLTSSNLQKNSNELAHRTNDYINKDLIVRRGQAFNIELQFNKTLQPADSLSLKAETGTGSTNFVMPISSTSSGKPWNATSSSLNTNSLKVTMNTPADAIIGRYHLSLEISSEGNTTTILGDFILLFNPWVTEDAVYMKSVEEKKEYVLNQTGVIFFGSSKTIRSRPWDFGQFEEGILDASLKLLESSIDYRRDPAKDVIRRNDPGYVGRVLSAMVNSQNDNGVLVGNWSGDYEGGERPTKWNGSVDILRQWMESGPVRYGQCWVYAGVLCTVLRSLGIPARVITNFSSAHDTDENLIVDRYYDEDGKEDPETEDSVWNFHAWDEAWFARPDIGAAYNGWQVLDATPQEESQGSYRLGPCSVQAVKEGDVDLQHDVPFVFSELNADRIDWMVNSDGSMKKIRTNTQSVGQLTSTKAVGSDARQDVTNNYKYAEGTAKERQIYKKAQGKLQGSASMNRRRQNVAFSASDPEPAPKPDFQGTITESSESLIGQDVQLTLTLKNISANAITLQVKMSATAIVYTNASVKDILTNAQSVSLGPNEEQKIPLTITYTQYQDAITADNMIKVVALCEDEKGGKLLVETIISLKNPPIVIKAKGEAQVNKPLHLEIAFTNPIAEDVDNSVLTIEGSGLVKQPITIEIPSLKKNERSVTGVDIVPYRDGQRSLMVDLSSDKFSDVKGTLAINVAPA